MKKTDIVKSLQETIDSGDENLLQILYATAAAYKKQHEGENAYELTEWQKEELIRRSMVNEPGVRWEDAKERILSSKKS